MQCARRWSRAEAEADNCDTGSTSWSSTHTLRITATVRVLYFASVRDALGTGGETLAGAATLGDVVAHVRSRLTAAGGADAAARLLGGCAFAVNDAYVDDRGTSLADGDEVAVLPPVSGG